MRLKKPKTYSGTSIAAIIWVVVFLLWAAILSAQDCDSPIVITNQTDSICWQAPLDTSDAWIPDCPNFSGGSMFWLMFETDGNLPVSIMINSDLEYEGVGNPIVWCHLIITDGCEGSTVWGTTACGLAMTQYVINTSAPGTDWYVDLNLPAGQYWIHAPIGIETSSENIVEGCFTITVFSPGLLGLSVEEYYFFKPQYMNYDILGRRL